MSPLANCIISARCLCVLYCFMCCADGAPLSAVLLVDTAGPEWTILHTSTGWDMLQAQLQGHAATAGSNSSSSCVVGGPLWALLDGDTLDALGSTGGSSSVRQQMLHQVGGAGD